MQGKPQIQYIKDHLERGYSISSYEAFLLYGCTRLSAKIYELRHKYNMNIDSKCIKHKLKTGNESWFYAYYLESEEDECKCQ